MQGLHMNDIGFIYVCIWMVPIKLRMLFFFSFPDPKFPRLLHFHRMVPWKIKQQSSTVLGTWFVNQNIRNTDSLWEFEWVRIRTVDKKDKQSKHLNRWLSSYFAEHAFVAGIDCQVPSSFGSIVLHLCMLSVSKVSWEFSIEVSTWLFPFLLHLFQYAHVPTSQDYCSNEYNGQFSIRMQQRLKRNSCRRWAPACLPKWLEKTK